MKNQSNDLRYTATKTVGEESITVNIRLNDECKNGHQDFAITADIYKAGKPRTDKNWLGGGCQHEVIAAAFPEFIPFIKLHLADYAGIPMYAVENGFYHLTNGFNSKSTNEAFKAEYCDYYRVKPAQFDTLKLSHNQTQFALNLMNLGILDQWKAEAQAAIKQLEDLTGLSFLNDSKKSQFHAPTAEEIQDNENNCTTGLL